jgi:hypothetical protein
MRHLVIGVGALLLFSPCFGIASDEPGLQDKIQGTWVAVEGTPDRVLTRLVISQDDKGLSVEVWALRGLREERVGGKTPLRLLRAGSSKGPVERGFATWDPAEGGKPTVYATLKLKDRDLLLEYSKVYRETPENSWFASYVLKKK